jgi:hypothetical protein
VDSRFARAEWGGARTEDTKQHRTQTDLPTGHQPSCRRLRHRNSDTKEQGFVSAFGRSLDVSYMCRVAS